MTGKGRAETWDGEAGTEESQGSEGHSGRQGGESGGRTPCVREREQKSGRHTERILSHLNLASCSSDKAGEGATSVIFQTCLQENILYKK